MKNIKYFIAILSLLCASCTNNYTDCSDASCNTLLTMLLYSGNADTSIFVAVGQNGTLRTSTDGHNWNQQSLAVTTLNGIGLGTDMLYAAGANDTAFASTNGLSWTQLASLNTGTSDSYFAIANYNGILVAGGSAGVGQVRRSTDGGQSWTNLAITNAMTQLEDLEVGGNQLRGVNGNGDYMYFNSDATAHSATTPTGLGSGLTALAYCDGVWVVVAPAGYIARTANDGATWNNQVTDATFNLEDVACGNGRFVAVGHNGTNAGVFTSQDAGFTWVKSNPPFGRTRGVAYGSGKFVIVGNGGLIAYTTIPEISTGWTDVSTGTDHSFDISSLNGTRFRLVGTL
ncbi:MAG: hypothetical protein KDK34_19240 [Leptospiraceae bacterium]|nr:hypothetical protein [Leptospiraceae bacterium]